MLTTLRRWLGLGRSRSTPPPRLVQPVRPAPYHVDNAPPRQAPTLRPPGTGHDPRRPHGLRRDTADPLTSPAAVILLTDRARARLANTASDGGER